MAIQRANAVVLRRFPVRETSLVVVFFSREFGKLHGILKGIRSNPKKFNSSADLFTLNEVIFYPSRSSQLHLVSQCNLIESLLETTDKQVYSIAGYLMRLVDVVTPVEQPNIKLFDMLVAALKLASKVESKLLIRTFEIKLLDLSGFRPYIDGCVSCLRRDFVEGWFSNKEGGLLCNSCLYRDPSAHKLSPGIIKAMRAIEQVELARALRIGLPRQLEELLNQIIHGFLEYHLGRKIEPIGV